MWERCCALVLVLAIATPVVADVPFVIGSPPLWHTLLSSGDYSISAQSVAGRIVVESSGTISVIDGSTGQFTSAALSPSRYAISFVIWENSVVSLNRDCNMSSHDVVTGNLQWITPLANCSEHNRRLAIVNDVLVFSFEDVHRSNQLQFFAAATGAATGSVAGTYVAPCFLDGFTIVQIPRRSAMFSVCLVNSSTGTVVWCTANFSESIYGVFCDNAVAVIVRTNNATAVSKASGTILWNYTNPNPYGSVSSALLLPHSILLLFYGSASIVQIFLNGTVASGSWSVMVHPRQMWYFPDVQQVAVFAGDNSLSLKVFAQDGSPIGDAIDPAYFAASFTPAVAFTGGSWVVTIASAIIFPPGVIPQGVPNDVGFRSFVNTGPRPGTFVFYDLRTPDLGSVQPTLALFGYLPGVPPPGNDDLVLSVALSIVGVAAIIIVAAGAHRHPAVLAAVDVTESSIGVVIPLVLSLTTFTNYDIALSHPAGQIAVSSPPTVVSGSYSSVCFNPGVWMQDVVCPQFKIASPEYPFRDSLLRESQPNEIEPYCCASLHGSVTLGFALLVSCCVLEGIRWILVFRRRHSWNDQWRFRYHLVCCTPLNLIALLLRPGWWIGRLQSLHAIGTLGYFTGKIRGDADDDFRVSHDNEAICANVAAYVSLFVSCGTTAATAIYYAAAPSVFTATMCAIPTFSCATTLASFLRREWRGRSEVQIESQKASKAIQLKTAVTRLLSLSSVCLRIVWVSLLAHQYAFLANPDVAFSFISVAPGCFRFAAEATGDICLSCNNVSTAGRCADYFRSEKKALLAPIVSVPTCNNFDRYDLTCTTTLSTFVIACSIITYITVGTESIRQLLGTWRGYRSRDRWEHELMQAPADFQETALFPLLLIVRLREVPNFLLGDAEREDEALLGGSYGEKVAIILLNELPHALCACLNSYIRTTGLSWVISVNSVVGVLLRFGKLWVNQLKSDLTGIDTRSQLLE